MMLNYSQESRFLSQTINLFIFPLYATLTFSYLYNIYVFIINWIKFCVYLEYLQTKDFKFSQVIVLIMILYTINSTPCIRKQS